MKRLIENNPNTKAHWDEVYRNDLYDLNVDNIKHQLIALQVMDGSRVVDYGCGPGEILSLIKKLRPHCQIVGVDQSIYKTDLTIVEGDIYTPITHAADYVISTEVLEHVDKPQRAVDCLYDSLHDGGTAFVSTPFSDHIPSEEHIWEFQYEDILPLFNKFTQTWIFPFASGRAAFFTDGRVYPPGNVDTILVRAIK